MTPELHEDTGRGGAGFRVPLRVRCCAGHHRGCGVREHAHELRAYEQESDQHTEDCKTRKAVNNW